MIRFWDVEAACTESEAEAEKYAATLASRVEKLCFWMWWYCEWAVLGYDQYNRWDIRPYGESDCSSLTYWCLWKAGYLTRPVGNLYDYTLYTGSIRADLVAAGWTVKPVDGNPQDGWVLLNDGCHVAVWIGNGMLAQSSIDENGHAHGGQTGDQTGRETYCRNYYNYPWSCYLAPPPDPEPKPSHASARPTDNDKGGSAGPVYRLYNPFTFEHLWTQSKAEYDNLGGLGWHQEGVAWTSPASGRKVHRMRNPYADAPGAHHFTVSLDEACALYDLGWENEDIAWFSGGDVKIYRLYNPYTGEHFFTSNKDEALNLMEQGWTFENVGFMAER